MLGEFNPQRERSRIYELVYKSVPEERTVTKEIIKKKAIQISLEELDELNEAFEEFMKSVSHLSIYKHLYKDVVHPYWRGLDTSARELILKNYTEQELEIMPREVYGTILGHQRVRLELIKGIIENYKLGK